MIATYVRLKFLIRLNQVNPSVEKMRSPFIRQTVMLNVEKAGQKTNGKKCTRSVCQVEGGRKMKRMRVKKNSAQSAPDSTLSRLMGGVRVDVGPNK